MNPLPAPDIVRMMERMNMTRSRYTGPQAYNQAERRKYQAIRRKYPEAYVTAGIGWCGPGWQEVEEAMKALQAEHDARIEREARA